MKCRNLVLAVSVLALSSLSLSPSALAAGSITKKVKAVGNSVTIKISGGNPPVVQQTNSCSPGVTGYIYQSIVIFFSGGSITTTQSLYCP
jgi:hypothetical protein